MELMQQVRPMSLIRARSTTLNVKGERVVYSEPAIGVVNYIDKDRKNGHMCIFCSRSFDDHEVMEILMEDASSIYLNVILYEKLGEVSENIKDLADGLVELQVDVTTLLQTAAELKTRADMHRQQAFNALPKSIQDEFVAENHWLTQGIDA